MNTVIQTPWHLIVDLRAEPGQAAKGRLDVSARAAEPIIEVEMAKGGVEIVPPHQPHHAPAKPDAFRVPSRAVDGLGGLDEFVGFLLIVLGGIGRIGGWRFAGLIRGAGVAALGDRASHADQEGKPWDGEVAQNRILKLKHTSTHRNPDFVSCPAASPDAARVMPVKWVPNAAGTAFRFP